MNFEDLQGPLATGEREVFPATRTASDDDRCEQQE